MFINCPHCAALLATDPATDLPPERCPRCAARLREPVPEKTSAADKVTIVATVPDEPEDDLLPVPAMAATVSADADAPSEASAPATQAAEPDAHPQPEQAPEADTEIGTPADGDAETPAAPPVDASAVELSEKAMIDASAVVAEDSAPSGSDEIASDAAASDDAVAMSESAADIALAAGDGPPTQTPAMPRRDKPAPSFVRTRQRMVVANARRRWALPSLIAGLSLLLALQWVLADRARLAADARWRPFVVQLCGMLRCSLPPWREPSAFALLERDVRAHPTVAGALRVTATFRNDAHWPQPWPDVVLTLSDVDGHAVGARTFVAGEYLGARPTQNALSSGQSATIRMDVLEPAPRIVAFAFDFR